MGTASTPELIENRLNSREQELTRRSLWFLFSVILTIALTVLIQIVQTHVLTRYSERTKATEIETIDLGPPQVCDAPIRKTVYVDEPRCQNVSSSPCYLGANGHKICSEEATVDIHLSAVLASEKYSLRLGQLHDQLELIGFLDLLGYLALVSDFGVAFVGAWWAAEVGREPIRWRAPASPLSH